MMNNEQREGWMKVVYNGAAANDGGIYFGEVLINADVCDGDSVYVQLGGNASADMWAQLAAAMQEKGGAAAVRMKVKRMGKRQERPTQRGDVFADRVQELAAELMQHALDDMQERAQDGMLVLLDDDGNAHTISPMQEDGGQSVKPTSGWDKLAQQMQRVDRWAQQQDAEHEQRRKCEVAFRNNCMYIIPQESDEQEAKEEDI